MIIIDKTFEIVTEESAESGEVEDAGFSSIGEKVSFRDLVSLLSSHYIHASQSPVVNSTHVWFTSESEQDYRTGEYRSESIHFSPDNPVRMAKYWIKAMEFAGYKFANHCNL